MPVRLLKAYGGQAANTLYWGADQGTLRAAGIADDYTDQASDYGSGGDRVVTAATASTSVNATTYRMNSATAQTLTINPSGYWNKDSILTVIQEGVGVFTLVAATGVTLNTSAASLVSKGQYYIAQLVKGAGETWDVVGGIG